MVCRLLTRLLPITIVALMAVQSTAVLANEEPINDQDLAYHWAPVHYQDTAKSGASQDYLSRVDFDGDFIGDNNWDHQATMPEKLTGAAYTSVTETSSHWFIIYAFFHPRDWTDLPFHKILHLGHENDMEGALFIIRKDGSHYGVFDGMVTVFHRNFYSFIAADGPLVAGHETIDGKVIFQQDRGVARPTTFQGAKGHGLKAYNGRRFPGGDGIVYYPMKDEDEIKPPRDGNDRHAGYHLVNIFAPGGLWDRRFDSQLFADWGTFRGGSSHGHANSANAPWGWRDVDDGMSRGQLATDPAAVAARYFGPEGLFSLEYLKNHYRS